MEVIESALPTDIFMERAQQSMRFQNLARTVNLDRTAYFELEDCTDPENGPFWLDLGRNVPSPSDMAEVFLIDRENPHYLPIELWVVDAYDLHTELENQTHVLHNFLKGVRHISWVKNHWPEVVPFLGEVNYARVENAKYSRERGRA